MVEVVSVVEDRGNPGHSVVSIIPSLSFQPL
jgi:hypothetical protein